MIKNIVSDAKKLLTATIESDTKLMTDYERKAYAMGIDNAFRAIEAIGTDTGRCTGCKLECVEEGEQGECTHCSRAYSDEFESVK